MKICRCCKITDADSVFTKSANICKPCLSKIHAEYRKNNKEKISAKKSEYSKNNSELLKYKSARYYAENKEVSKENQKKYVLNNLSKVKQYQKEYRERNREKLSDYRRKYTKDRRELVNKKNTEYLRSRRSSDSLFKLRGNLNCLIRISIQRQGYRKTSKTHEVLGADFLSVQQHLIKTAIMNYGKYFPRRPYHIDHVIPCSTASNEKELIALHHYTNLQYLYPKDNLKKSDMILERTQRA